MEDVLLSHVVLSVGHNDMGVWKCGVPYSHSNLISITIKCKLILTSIIYLILPNEHWIILICAPE